MLISTRSDGRAGGRRRLALVAYGGTQVPGYQVAQVSVGWTIQGGNAFVLTLALIGDTGSAGPVLDTGR